MADMTGDQLDRALAKLGMTQSGAARYFDVTSRTMRRYIADHAPIPVPIILVLAALSTGIGPHTLRRRAGLDRVMLALILLGCLLGCASTAMAESTTQRDAPTTRFYDSRGNSTGSASTYGNRTEYYDARGNHTGTATSHEGKTK